MKRSFTYIRNSLINHYSRQEIESIIFLIVNNIYNYSKNDLILNSNRILSESEFSVIEKIVKRLKESEPIQYILGETEFYSLTFKVNPSVLIPRGETEELVDLVLKRTKNNAARILDIGTGSGCIPISIKSNLPTAHLVAFDISDKALETAKKNATLNNVEINFYKYDILNLEKPAPETDFHIIISNPPYVTDKEKELMEDNVLKNEPHLALFVPNTDPLRFYRAIIKQAETLLNPNGEIYFEINEAYGEETLCLMKENHYNAELFTDLNGKDRIVYGKRNY